MSKDESEQDAGVKSSGRKGDNPATAGQGETKAGFGTPEKQAGQINPSAPEDSNVTPGSAGEK